MRERASAVLTLGVVLALAYLAVRRQLFVSWSPSDEGVLAQGAERVMRGELPHRDFVDLWSGGLDALNAAGFAAFGTRLTSLRVVVAAAWLVGLAAMFASARHLLTSWLAGALTLCAALWTLPLSPHPLPSWFNLFLALIGVASILNWIEKRRAIWLVAAGAAAGASIAVKIVGLYFVAAAVMFFVWQVQDDVRAAPDGRRTAARGYAWMITAGMLGFLALVGQLVYSQFKINTVLHFFVPNLLLVGALLWREWRLPANSERERFRAFFALATPFAAGAAIAMIGWILPYVHEHAVADLLRGLFVLPRIRLTSLTYPLPGIRSAALAVAPFALLLAGAPFVRRPLRRADDIALALTVAIALALAYDGSPVVLMTWYGLRLLTPFCAALATWWLVAPPAGMEIPRERRALVFFLVATACTESLVQIPFGLYTYFLYFVPLLALAVAALMTSQSAMPKAVPAALLAFVLLFGARSPDSIGPRREPPRPQDALALLALPRAGLIVTREDSTTYTQLVESIQRHAHGEWMYVWHDAPQIYFLAGLRNPTRTTLEVFEDSLDRSAATLSSALRARDVRVVVLTDPSGAARPLDPAFRAWLIAEYPESERVERFDVRWRRDPFDLKR
jgi:hypothetical protein